MPGKLLTIAIPTWNREKLLEKTLAELLLQVDECADDVQLVISDNASDDNTAAVVNGLLADYPGIEAISFRQKENTGYYGNFKKCRELSEGKYFWLLSDNELISHGLVKKIIDELKSTEEIGIVYLDNIPGSTRTETRLLEFDELFGKRNYKLTFISACILLNRKETDEKIFDEFHGNSFLGYALLLSARRYAGKALEISGEIYQSLPAVVSFNVFKCWTYDIFQCFSFIEKENLFAKDAVEKMKESILENVLRDHLFHYKLYNSYYGRDLGPFKQNYSLLQEFYGPVNNFHILKEIGDTPRAFLFYRLYRGKVMNRSRKLIRKLSG